MRRLCHQAVPEGVIRSFLVTPITEGWREEKAAVLGGFEHSRDKKKHDTVLHLHVWHDMPCMKKICWFFSRASFLGALNKARTPSSVGLTRSDREPCNCWAIFLSKGQVTRFSLMIPPPDAPLAHWNMLLTISSGAGFCTSTVGYLRVFIIVMAWRKECHTRSKMHPKYNFKKSSHIQTESVAGSRTWIAHKLTPSSCAWRI